PLCRNGIACLLLRSRGGVNRDGVVVGHGDDGALGCEADRVDVVLRKVAVALRSQAPPVPPATRWSYAATLMPRRAGQILPIRGEGQRINRSGNEFHPPAEIGDGLPRFQVPQLDN